MVARRRARAAAAACASMVGFTYRRVPGDRAGPAAGRRGPARRRSGTCARSTCRTGSSTRESPLVWRLQKEQGRLRRARRHRRAHRRPGPVRHRPDAITGCQRRCIETFVKERPLAGGVAPACPARPATGRGDGHRRRRRAVPRPVRRRRARRRSRRPGSPPAARTRSGSRSTARAGSLAFDFEDMNELQFYDADEPAATAGLPPDPGHRADAPVRRRVVAARATGSATSTRFTHQVVDLVDRDRRRRPARTRRSPTGCRCSGCWPRSSSSADSDAAWTRPPMRRRATDRRRLTMTRPITLFTGQWADLPFEEVVPARLRVGLRRPGDRLLGRPLRRRRGRSRTTPTSQGKLEILEKHGLKVCAISNHLNGQAVCDDPIDERHQGILPDRRLGRRRPRGRAAAGRRGDEDDRPGRRAARRRHRRRLHRVVDLEVRRDVPAGARRR